MKKLLLISALMASTAMQAQNAESVTYYWPGQRVETLTSGQQYFIYNTANDGKDRSVFLYSNGSALRTTNVSPLTFITTENKYLFTLTKPDSPTDETHWYMNSIDGIVGHGGMTNNTEKRDIYIAGWFGNENITKSTAQSEDENGTLQNPNDVDTHVWAITCQAGLVGNAGDSYAWNGNEAGDNSWTRWREAHPYAFYTANSAEINVAAYAYSQELTAQNGKLGKIAFNLQKCYGLVQDGTKYYSNYKESTEGSYEALVDGNDGTFFHSAYNNGGAAEDPKHYLRAELSSATNNFYFITKRRTQNNNNRPTNILIEGSNEADGTYTTITTVSSGLPTAENDYFYFSEKITSDVAYKYIRFTPLTTSPEQTRFFTYSEFYVINANEETDAAMSAVHGLYNCKGLTIKDADFNTSYLTAGQAFDEQLEKTSFSTAKNDANQLITANQNNHAETPALGQYPTAAYDTFKSAIGSATTSEELAAAIHTFKFSINAPVFTIDGAFTGGYVTVGKSIYYDGTTPLRWDKATNKYDKTMLWKFIGSTSTTAEVGQTYTVGNMSEDVYFWNVEQLQVTATNPENENGIILIKTQGNNTPVHAQSDGVIVRWDNSDPTSASAWKITYVGESFKIDQIDEAKLADYTALKALVAECEPYVEHLGDGMHQFSCKGFDFESVLNEAKAIATQDIYENPTLDATAAKKALQDAKDALAINQPEAGKYYRFKSAVNSNYIASNGTGQVLMTDNAADAVFYLTADNRLITNSLLAMDNYNATATLGKTTTFKASKANIGTYVIRNNGGSYFAKATGEALDRHGDENTGLTTAACAWIIEEVTDASKNLTKNMTAEYATLAAPVSLVIPEGIKAYTAQVNGQKATLSEVTGGIIPAGTAVVLQKTGAENEYVFNFDATAAVENESNNLVGVYAETAVPAETKAYILAQPTGKEIGFYLLDESARIIGANKAYLVAPAEAAGIKAFTFDFGGTTGIDNTEAVTEAEEYYDLQGRRVMNPTKGIYVTKSGRKVLFY